MTPFEVYFDTREDIDSFAEFLRHLLNLADENQSPHQREQRRDGANYGGLYYLFEVFGIELILLSNVEEVMIPERFDYALYLIVQGGSESFNRTLAEKICELVESRDVRACVDSLST